MTLKKNIHIEFPNGDVYSIPIKKIARNRTDFYSGQNKLEYRSNEWYEELEKSMQEGFLLDWIQNNMGWEDIEHIATPVLLKVINYDRLFKEAKFKIKENE